MKNYVHVFMIRRFLVLLCSTPEKSNGVGKIMGRRGRTTKIGFNTYPISVKVFLNSFACIFTINYHKKSWNLFFLFKKNIKSHNFKKYSSLILQEKKFVKTFWHIVNLLYIYPDSWYLSREKVWTHFNVETFLNAQTMGKNGRKTDKLSK